MNKFTGEVTIELGNNADGQKAIYNIVYNWKALAAFQSKFGKDAKITDLSIKDIAETLLIGLAAKHPNLSLDFVMESSPPIALVTDKIVEAMVYANHGIDDGIKLLTEMQNQMQDIQDAAKSEIEDAKKR